MIYHPDVLAAHAQFGGDLESMQKLYEYPDLVTAITALSADLEQYRNVEETTHGLYQFWNAKAQELAASNDALRLENEALRREVGEVRDGVTKGDNQPRYTTKRMHDEIAKAKAYARREALREAEAVVADYAGKQSPIAAAIRSLPAREDRG